MNILNCHIFVLHVYKESFITMALFDQAQVLNMRYPEWRESPPYVNSASTQEEMLSCMEVVTLQRAHALEIQEIQRSKGIQILFPCNWCGQPTGDWCEDCHEVDPHNPLHALCIKCEALWMQCRLCRFIEEECECSI